MFDVKNRLPDRILAHLNTKSKKPLTHEDIVVSYPLTQSENGDTLVWIKGRKERNFVGNIPVRFKRQALSDLFFGISASVNLDKVFSTDQVLPLLRQQYGIELTADDIVVESVDLSDEKIVVLAASEKSYNYYGKVTIGHREVLSDLFDDAQVELELDIPTPTLNAATYSWPFAFTSLEFVEEINEANFGDHLELLSIALSEETKDDWVFTNKLEDFNVEAATFVSNGPVEPGLERPETHVLKFRVSEEYCRNMTGVIHMFYIPIDGIAATEE